MLYLHNKVKNLATVMPLHQLQISNYSMINHQIKLLTLILLFKTTPTFANSVDPDQMASEEAI